MTADELPTAPMDNGSGDEARRRRRERRRRHRRRRRVGLVVGTAVVVTGTLILGGATGDMPSRVSVGGVDVGGLSVADARAKLEGHSREVLRGSVSITSAQEPSFSLDVAASTLAARARIDEALAAARDSRGRFGRALAKLGIAGRKEIPLRYVLREKAVAALTREATTTLGRTAVSASVRVAGDEIVTTAARPGRAVDRAALVTRLETLPASLALTLRNAQPAVDDGEAGVAQALGRRVVATARDVTLDGKTALLVPAVVRKALRFPVDRKAGAIGVRLDPDILRSVLVKPLGTGEQSPSDARLEIRGDRVVVIPSRTGRLLDGAALSAAIVADPDAATVPAKIRTVPADFTTAEARALKITEKVSEFTTPYACCQPRVTNIQRAAQVLNGRIIPAGNRFSLNDALGERITARGYVKAPTIAAGELVESVGGGVSQVATTMYNAAFFAGLALEAHTPHEFYISRYPMGREATVSWRQPDLVFRNDWDAAILISAQAGSNAITIRFYSSKLGRRVETSTGEPTNPTEPKTIERQNPQLPPGTRKVIQSAGAGGFSITYTRKVFAGAKVKRDETFRWTYRPQNAIVELGPPKPEEPRPPAEPDTPENRQPGTGTTPTTPGGAPPPTSTDAGTPTSP
jgi:vancomycin resistance protein YoaR